MENEHEARALIAIEVIAAELCEINVTLFQLLKIVIDNQDD